MDHPSEGFLHHLAKGCSQARTQVLDFATSGDGREDNLKRQVLGGHDERESCCAAGANEQSPLRGSALRLLKWHHASDLESRTDEKLSNQGAA